MQSTPMNVDVLPVATGEVEGNPAVDRVLSLAEQYDATRHLLSVTEKVVRSADLPALTVPLS